MSMREAEYHALAGHERTHWWYRSLREKVKRALREAHFPKNGILVDIGCGTAGMAEVLRRGSDPRYFGLDPHPTAIAYARHRKPWGLACGRIENLPLKGAMADGALSLDSLYFAQDVGAALEEVRGLLKAGGLLVLNVPAFHVLRGAHDEAVGCRRRFRWAEMKKLMTEGGFQVASHEYWNSLLFLPLLAWRWFSRIPGRAKKTSEVGLSGGFLNAPLSALIALESGMARLIPFPFGASLFVVAKKR